MLTILREKGAARQHPTTSQDVFVHRILSQVARDAIPHHNEGWYVPETQALDNITAEIDQDLTELVVSGEDRLLARVGRVIEADQFAHRRGDDDGDELEAWGAFSQEEGEGWPGVSDRSLSRTTSRSSRTW